MHVIATDFEIPVDIPMEDENLRRIFQKKIRGFHTLESLLLQYRLKFNAMPQEDCEKLVERIYAVSEPIWDSSLSLKAYHILVCQKNKPQDFPENCWTDLYEELNRSKREFLDNFFALTGRGQAETDAESLPISA